MTPNDLPEPIRAAIQAGYESFAVGASSKHLFTRYVADHPDTDPDAFDKGWALADACDFIRYCDNADRKSAESAYIVAVDAINQKYGDVAVSLDEGWSTTRLGTATEPGTFGFGLRRG